MDLSEITGGGGRWEFYIWIRKWGDPSLQWEWNFLTLPWPWPKISWPESDSDSDSWSLASPISPRCFLQNKELLFFLRVNLYMNTDTSKSCDPPSVSTPLPPANFWQVPKSLNFEWSCTYTENTPKLFYVASKYDINQHSELLVINLSHLLNVFIK